MTMGRSKLGKILAKEIGITAKDVRVYGMYECFGNKERIILGAHTIVAMDGEVSIMEPAYGSFDDDRDVAYRKRKIEGGANSGETDA